MRFRKVFFSSMFILHLLFYFGHFFSFLCYSYNFQFFIIFFFLSILFKLQATKWQLIKNVDKGGFCVEEQKVWEVADRLRRTKEATLMLYSLCVRHQDLELMNAIYNQKLFSLKTTEGNNAKWDASSWKLHAGDYVGLHWNILVKIEGGETFTWPSRV